MSVILILWRVSSPPPPTPGQTSTGIQTAKENPEQRLVITGYTDNTGPAEYNLRLSKERAEAVAKGLVSLGVDPKRLTVEGKGIEDLVASNATEQGRAQNRRTEVRFEGM